MQNMTQETKKKDQNTITESQNRRRENEECYIKETKSRKTRTTKILKINKWTWEKEKLKQHMSKENTIDKNKNLGSELKNECKDKKKLRE